jgi:UDP-sugar transporter A1/2/3
MYQLKVFTTALFAVMLLGKKLTVGKWFSLLLLFVGVCIIQLDLTENPKEPGTTSGSNTSHSFPAAFTGSLAVLAATVTSGFAGVYFEKILKESKVSLWVRNLQLGLLGIISSSVIVYANDSSQIFGPKGKGFFFGWNWVVVVVVLNQALGGFLVALVVKYADNILKGFAVSFSIILSSILSIFVFDFTFSFYFLVGTVLVLVSVYIYQLPVLAPTSNHPPV